MAITAQDLSEFHLFAEQKVSTGSVDSMDDLVREWNALRERQEVNAAIQKGIQAIEDGHVQPFEESQAKFRQAHNLPPRQ